MFQRLGSPQPRIKLALTQPNLDSSGDLARHIQTLQGGALPVLTLQVKGPNRALSDPDGQYNHPGVALEEAYLKSQYAGACAVKNIFTIKRAAGRPSDTYLENLLALSIEITIQAVQVICHWITSHNGKDQYRSRRTHTPVHIHCLPRIQKVIRNAID